MAETRKATSAKQLLKAYEIHGNDCVVLDFSHERKPSTKSTVKISYIDTYIKLEDGTQVKAYLKFSCLPIYGCKKPKNDSPQQYTPSISFLAKKEESDNSVSQALLVFATAWEYQVQKYIDQSTNQSEKKKKIYSFVQTERKGENDEVITLDEPIIRMKLRKTSSTSTDLKAKIKLFDPKLDKFVDVWHSSEDVHEVIKGSLTASGVFDLSYTTKFTLGYSNGSEVKNMHLIKQINDDDEPDVQELENLLSLLCKK